MLSETIKQKIMNNQDVTKILKEALLNYFKEQGFKWLAKESCLVNKNATCENRIYVAVFNYFPEYLFSLAFTQRFPSIEELFHKFSETPAQYQGQSHTINLPLSYFSNDNTVKFKVTTEEEVKQTIEALLGKYGSIIKNYFTEVTTEEKLEKIINAGYQPFDQPSRAMHGLILAKKYNTQHYTAIRQMYVSSLPKISAMEQSRLDKLLAYLESNT